jgi:AcrR family transcriptional regulator
MRVNNEGETPDLSDTQERLLRAMLETIYDYGIEKATTRRIAERAGVNLQLIQYHFGGKDGLLQAAQDYTRQRFFAAVEPAVMGAKDLPMALRDGLGATWATAREAPALMQADLLLQVRRAEARLNGERLPSRATRDRVGELLDELLVRSGERLTVPMEQFVLLLMGSAAGLLLEFRVSGETDTVDAAFGLLAELLVSFVEVG